MRLRMRAMLCMLEARWMTRRDSDDVSCGMGAHENSMRGFAEYKWT